MHGNLHKICVEIKRNLNLYLNIYKNKQVRFFYMLTHWNSNNQKHIVCAHSYVGVIDKNKHKNVKILCRNVDKLEFKLNC